MDIEAHSSIPTFTVNPPTSSSSANGTPLPWFSAFGRKDNSAPLPPEADPKYSDPEYYSSSSTAYGKGGRNSSHTAKKPEGHIKRPPNCFLLFRSHVKETGLKIPDALKPILKERMRERRREQRARRLSAPHLQDEDDDDLEDYDPDDDEQSVSKISGILWDFLPAAEKSVFRARAQHAKMMHKKLYPTYKYSPQVKDKTVKKRVGKKMPQEKRDRLEAMAGVLVTGMGWDHNSGGENGSNSSSKAASQSPAPPSMTEFEIGPGSVPGTGTFVVGGYEHQLPPASKRARTTRSGSPSKQQQQQQQRRGGSAQPPSTLPQSHLPTLDQPQQPLAGYSFPNPHYQFGVRDDGSGTMNPHVHGVDAVNGLHYPIPHQSFQQPMSAQPYGPSGGPFDFAFPGGEPTNTMFPPGSSGPSSAMQSPIATPASAIPDNVRMSRRTSSCPPPGAHLTWADMGSSGPSPVPGWSNPTFAPSPLSQSYIPMRGAGAGNNSLTSPPPALANSVNNQPHHQGPVPTVRRQVAAGGVVIPPNHTLVRPGGKTLRKMRTGHTASAKAALLNGTSSNSGAAGPRAADPNTSAALAGGAMTLPSLNQVLGSPVPANATAGNVTVSTPPSQTRQDGEWNQGQPAGFVQPSPTYTASTASNILDTPPMYAGVQHQQGQPFLGNAGYVFPQAQAQPAFATPEKGYTFGGDQPQWDSNGYGMMLGGEQDGFAAYTFGAPAGQPWGAGQDQQIRPQVNSDGFVDPNGDAYPVPPSTTRPVPANSKVMEAPSGGSGKLGLTVIAEDYSFPPRSSPSPPSATPTSAVEASTTTQQPLQKKPKLQRSPAILPHGVNTSASPIVSPSLVSPTPITPIPMASMQQRSRTPQTAASAGGVEMRQQPMMGYSFPEQSPGALVGNAGDVLLGDVALGINNDPAHQQQRREEQARHQRAQEQFSRQYPTANQGFHHLHQQLSQQSSATDAVEQGPLDSAGPTGTWTTSTTTPHQAIFSSGPFEMSSYVIAPATAEHGDLSLNDVVDVEAASGPVADDDDPERKLSNEQLEYEMMEWRRASTASMGDAGSGPTSPSNAANGSQPAPYKFGSLDAAVAGYDARRASVSLSMALGPEMGMALYGYDPASVLGEGGYPGPLDAAWKSPSNPMIVVGDENQDPSSAYFSRVHHIQQQHPSSSTHDFSHLTDGPGPLDTVHEEGHVSSEDVVTTPRGTSVVRSPQPVHQQYYRPALSTRRDSRPWIAVE